MILGMSTEMFTRWHVIISLIAIVAGMLVLLGLLTKRKFPILTAIFFLFTALTSLTGFLFPFKGMTPGILFGILSLVALIAAGIARYAGHLEGAWRGTYVIATNVAIYLNVFVLFAQIFDKVPELKAMAPTHSAPAFQLTQLAILVLFVAVTFRAFRKFQLA
jgi:hypothetical protein